MVQVGMEALSVSPVACVSGRVSGRRLCAAAVVGLLALPVLAACQSTEPLGRIVLPEVQPWDPPLNPNPRHVVRLHGRAPETLDFRFHIGFRAGTREGDCYNHAGFWEGGGEKGWGYHLYPVRTGEQWNADLVVDRYLPGRCNWNISASVLILVEPTDAREGDSLGAGARMVVTDARALDESAPRCARNSRCFEDYSRLLSNADDAIPVQVRCRRVARTQTVGRSTAFICNEFPQHKTTHRLKAQTRSIEIDLYDLDHEGVPE